jgi:hypothetical protein
MKELGNSETAVHEYFLQMCSNGLTRKKPTKSYIHAFLPWMSMRHIWTMLKIIGRKTGQSLLPGKEITQIQPSWRYTIWEKGNDAMMHHMYNLPFITWVWRGIQYRCHMLYWKIPRRLDQPVEKILSQENRRKLCHAIERGYKVYLSVIESSVNLSPSEKDKRCRRLEIAIHGWIWLYLVPLGKVYGKEWQDWCSKNGWLQSN